MRMPRSFTLMSLLFLAVVLLGHKSYGYEVNNHSNINERIFGFSEMKTYFDNELKMPLEGAGDNVFSNGSKRAIDLFKQGGVDEDDVPRWMNHYYDPTRSLFDGGLKDGYLGYSNLEWAQPGENDQSWWVAYDYLLAGLTASDNATRETSLSNPFL